MLTPPLPKFPAPFLILDSSPPGPFVDIPTPSFRYAYTPPVGVHSDYEASLWEGGGGSADSLKSGKGGKSHELLMSSLGMVTAVGKPTPLLLLLPPPATIVWSNGPALLLAACCSCAASELTPSGFLLCMHYRSTRLWSCRSTGRHIPRPSSVPFTTLWSLRLHLHLSHTHAPVPPFPLSLSPNYSPTLSKRTSKQSGLPADGVSIWQVEGGGRDHTAMGMPTHGLR